MDEGEEGEGGGNTATKDILGERFHLPPFSPFFFLSFSPYLRETAGSRRSGVAGSSTLGLMLCTYDMGSYLGFILATRRHFSRNAAHDFAIIDFLNE